MQLIHKPVITEKSLTHASRGWYTFAVPVEARKEYLAQEIHDAYKVDVVEVRTMRMPEKSRRVGKRMIKTTKPAWKKVLVRLKDGQKIDVYESVLTQMQSANK
jgi:large subunit ribosomal protein L23